MTGRFQATSRPLPGHFRRIQVSHARANMRAWRPVHLVACASLWRLRPFLPASSRRPVLTVRCPSLFCTSRAREWLECGTCRYWPSMAAVDFESVQPDRKSGVVSASRRPVTNDRYVVSAIPPVFLTSVFRWPRRTFVRHLGFPGRAYEDNVCHRVPVAASTALRMLAAMYSFVRLLLQWLCHAPSIPCCTVILPLRTSPDPAGPYTMIQIRHTIRSPSNASRKDLPACMAGCTLRRATSGCALRHDPVKNADASGHETALTAGCRTCRKRETRRPESTISVAHRQQCGLQRCVACRT